ncbi:molybdopterin-binding protein [Mucilaginibacter sp. UR6-1]|uniref:molybdopterin-binding protein n=1 Tax=Mucilaginibacter sp. UR6-1 TaxID=1435643 RepID=UPI001E5D66E0|nr:molybdopterin-binding protein [Mucilaginibacter sp. UR6-1]MCC8411051.1 molybdopterin-binding protein [Mucilaginibacter sp. UR6-1]
MKNKKWMLCLLALVCTTAVFAQQTKSFTITGVVSKAQTITYDSLQQYKVYNIDSLNVTSHTGSFKHKDEKLKGVLLTDVLSHIRFNVSSPKLLSELYLVCVASDGYKVVYSWNELYNTTVGETVFLLVEKNGISINTMPESIQMLSAKDHKTGRRYLHNLSKIIIAKAP